MGAGLAEVCARAGLDVVVVESDDSAAKAGAARLERSLGRAEAKAEIASASDVLARITIATDIGALASNTSSIPIMKLGVVAQRPPLNEPQDGRSMSR